MNQLLLVKMLGIRKLYRFAMTEKSYQMVFKNTLSFYDCDVKDCNINKNEISFDKFI